MFGSLSQRSNSRRTGRRTDHRHAVRRPSFEPLEDRCLLSFSARRQLPRRRRATLTEVVTADFNNDGNLDLATTNVYSQVSVLLGNGAGGFAAAQQFNPGANLLARGRRLKQRRQDRPRHRQSQRWQGEHLVRQRRRNFPACGHEEYLGLSVSCGGCRLQRRRQTRHRRQRGRPNRPGFRCCWATAPAASRRSMSLGSMLSPGSPSATSMVTESSTSLCGQRT